MLQGTCREGLKTQMRNFDKCQMKKNPFLFTIFTCKMIHVANTSFKAVMFWSASEIYTRSIADIVLVNYTKEQIMEIMVPCWWVQHRSIKSLSEADHHDLMSGTLAIFCRKHSTKTRKASRKETMLFFWRLDSMKTSTVYIPNPSQT